MPLPKTISLDELRKLNDNTKKVNKAPQKTPASPAPIAPQTGR